MVGNVPNPAPAFCHPNGHVYLSKTFSVMCCHGNYLRVTMKNMNILKIATRKMIEDR